MAEGDAAKTAKEFTEVSKQIDIALMSNKDNFNKMVEVLEILGPEVLKANADFDALAEKYGISAKKLEKVSDLTDASIEKRLLEGNIVKVKSQKELQDIVNKMQHWETLEKEGKIKLSSMQKAMMRGHKFELEMNKLKIKKMAASEEGFLKMMSVRWLEAQGKIQEGLHKYLGITLKTNSGVTKGLTGLTVAGIAAMVALKAFEKFGQTLTGVSDMSLLAGGYQGRNAIQQADFARKFATQISLSAGVGMTFKQATDAVNMASKEGAVALMQMEFAQRKVGATQQDVIDATIQATIELQKTSVGLFGTTEAFPQVIKAAKSFRLNLTNETQAMLGQIYRIGKDSGTHMQSLMNIINITGDRAFMTGQSIMETVEAMKIAGDTFGSLTKNTAETEALFDALGKALGGFDVMKYMAVMPGGGDIGAKYGAALEKGPIQAFGAYVNKLAGQIRGPNVAEKLALAIPEMRQMGKPGIALMQAFTSKGFQDKISGVKTKEEFKRALMETGQLTKEIADIGAARMFVEDPTEKILDVVTKMQGIMLGGFESIIKAIPGIGDGNKKLATQFKNKALEETTKGPKMAMAGGFK